MCADKKTLPPFRMVPQRHLPRNVCHLECSRGAGIRTICICRAKLSDLQAGDQRHRKKDAAPVAHQTLHRFFQACRTRTCVPSQPAVPSLAPDLPFSRLAAEILSSMMPGDQSHTDLMDGMTQLLPSRRGTMEVMQAPKWPRLDWSVATQTGTRSQKQANCRQNTEAVDIQALDIDDVPPCRTARGCPERTQREGRGGLVETLAQVSVASESSGRSCIQHAGRTQPTAHGHGHLHVQGAGGQVPHKHRC